MTRDTDAKHVRLLLCSHLGLPKGSAEKPLSVGEYTQLENAVDAAGVCDVADLLAHTPDELAALLGVPLPLAERIVRLFSRSAQVAGEVEHVESRGMWTLTRGDADYPQRWRTVLGDRAPVVLYGSGDRKLLHERCIAIVGSRNVAEDALEFARKAGRACAEAGLGVVSGAARGIDHAAMFACLDANGSVIGILADDLTRAIADSETREAVEANRLVFVKDYHYSAPFTVGHAMARNKLIYSLSEAAIIVSSDTSGGTWAGAQENLKSRWVPMFVRAGDSVPSGNLGLLRLGAHEIRSSQLRPEHVRTLRESALPPLPKSAAQQGLF